MISKIRRDYKKLILAVGLCAFSTAGNAAVFDFGDIAEGITFGGVDTPEIGDIASDAEGNWNVVVPLLPDGFLDNTLTIDGIGVVAQGFNTNSGEVNAFLDAHSGGPGGLGVCSSTSCTSGVSGASTGDDNVSGTGGGEWLKLIFDTSVIFDPTAFEFRAGNHSLLTGTLDINDITATIVAGALSAPTAALIASLTGTMHTFTFTEDQFYLTSATVSAVPLPAALPLFGGALGLMGLLGWRRKRMATA